MFISTETENLAYCSEHVAIIISFVFVRHQKPQEFSLSQTTTTENAIHFISIPVVYTKFPCEEHMANNRKKDC